MQTPSANFEVHETPQGQAPQAAIEDNAEPSKAEQNPVALVDKSEKKSKDEERQLKGKGEDLQAQRSNAKEG